MNTCDPCVSNVVVIGNHLAMMIRIDDAIMTHSKPQVVTDHVKLLDQ